ncbi:hypothetical protein [Paraburkholderia unamae]|uniref:DUF2029 domain-containing protein n=2 Tax=Paraburkholderia unamae TaxID=219649 RepID=A0ABX5KPA1_9BURK|nr:hypothetical protein [Paraburkholderia unamae]PVX82245.1 hypothetical protein C7402_10998 [Paraburkholderia unamae]
MLSIERCRKGGAGIVEHYPVARAGIDVLTESVMTSSDGSGSTTRALACRALLVSLYVLVAAASFCGFFAKYALRDDSAHDALPLMLDATADRPYVYRQLVPYAANLAEKALPAQVADRLIAHLQQDYPKHNWLANTFARATDASNPRYALRYHLVYFMDFAALLAGMLMLRAVCLELTGKPAAAALAPLAFALAMPAGNLWDFPELFFMALAVWFAARGKGIWLILLTPLATLNKESFLFFAVCLYPFLRERVSLRHALAVVGACVLAAGVVNVIMKLRYAGNPGDLAQFNLMTNLRFLANPRNYLLSDWTYGILLPKGFNIVILFVLFTIVRTGWKRLPGAARQHALIALAINVPLYLLFGWGDEVRALSMLYVTAALLLCEGIAVYMERAPRGAPALAMPARHESQASPSMSPR